MSARNLLNLVLALAVIGLALFVAFEPGKEPPPAKTLLTTLTTADIQHMEIRHGADAPVVLAKQNGQWRLQGLPAVNVNESKIDTLLALARATSHAHYSAASMNAEQTGLSKPELHISLNDTQLILGGTEPLNGRRYVQIGDTVHLMDDRYSYLLRGDAATFVDTALLPVNAALSEIHLPAFSLHEKEGHWVLEGSAAAPSADELQAFADEWLHARALRVSALQGKALRGEMVELHLRQQPEPLRFTVAHADNETLLIREDLGLRYHLSTSMAERLLKLPVAAPPEKAP